MATILLYIGIVLIVIGWLSLSWFAAKQVNAQKEYGKLPQKWEEIKRNLLHKRLICRGVVILGLIAIIISLTL
ncbi:MAG: hypothetical protein HFJ94_05250 [Muribaculaceae bacterium]|nr:hypothetical protein [Muribaculaceae bacterium]